MKTEHWALQDAKNKLSASVAMSRWSPTGVISMEEFEKLQQLEAQQLPTFADHLFNLPMDDVDFERMPVTPRDFA